MIGWLMGLFRRNPTELEDEDEIRRRVRDERKRLVTGKARASRVLADFHQAESVVKGDKRGINE